MNFQKKLETMNLDWRATCCHRDFLHVCFGDTLTVISFRGRHLISQAAVHRAPSSSRAFCRTTLIVVLLCVCLSVLCLLLILRFLCWWKIYNKINNSIRFTLFSNNKHICRKCHCSVWLYWEFQKHLKSSTDEQLELWPLTLKFCNIV